MSPPLSQLSPLSRFGFLQDAGSPVSEKDDKSAAGSDEAQRSQSLYSAGAAGGSALTDKINTQPAVLFQLSNNVNAPNKPQAQLFKYKTRGMGDCAFHAVFGQENKKEKEIICVDIVEKRKTLAKAIREVAQDHTIFPLVVKAIEKMLNSGAGSFKTLRGEYQKHLRGHSKSIDDAWRKLEQELKACQEIHQFITSQTKNRFGLDSYQQKFQHCLNIENGTLYCLVQSVDVLNQLFATYNTEATRDFNLTNRILQDRIILNEYAAYVEKKGQWLLPYEVNMIAHIFKVHIKFYSYNPYKNVYTNPEDFNLLKGKSSVSICFDGRGHFERVNDLSSPNAKSAAQAAAKL